MLGRFLELALVTEDPGAAWQNWQTLGFAPASTGDIWPHAYGVVTCGGLAIGLHGAGDEPMSLVFVRPEVAALHRELEAQGIEVEHCRLGSDVFNELLLREPGGVALRVLESRSFSPTQEDPARTALGEFVGISLPAGDSDESREFWQQLGAVCEAAPVNPLEDETGFRISGTPILIHDEGLLAEPALLFRNPQPELATLMERGGLRSARPPRGSRTRTRMMRTGGLLVLVD